MPATAAFWTISKLTRPDTSRTLSAQWRRSGQEGVADELVDRVVATDVLARLDEPSCGVEKGGGMQAACLLEDPLDARRASGIETMTERVTTGPETMTGQLDLDLVQGGLSADPAAGGSEKVPLARSPRERNRQIHGHDVVVLDPPGRRRSSGCGRSRCGRARAPR